MPYGAEMTLEEKKSAVQLAIEEAERLKKLKFAFDITPKEPLSWRQPNKRKTLDEMEEELERELRSRELFTYDNECASSTRRRRARQTLRHRMAQMSPEAKQDYFNMEDYECFGTFMYKKKY